MFIHFGVYSAFGGVYRGMRVTEGYSEQIMQFAPVPRSEYLEMARGMRLEKFSPHEIVSLAKDAGFSYIVVTAKHHDGFCMYRTETTGFNVVEQTLFADDVIALLSRECKNQGLGFGVYFSLVDWNLGHEYDPNNLNPISDEIEQTLCQQLTELMTRYGEICEVWFDMSSVTALQSRRFKEIVRTYQPCAMINGRIGNGEGDFITFWDNELPAYAPDAPWQTPQSIYPDTWGYRSWQKRGNAAERAGELAENYRYVRERGGNYLLNIGPRGDGSIDPFEREVITMFGKIISGERSENRRYRVLVGGFHHESNSLSRIISGEKDFRVIRGQEITENIVPNNALSGIVSTLKSHNVEVVPTLHMRGVPNGEVELEFFAKIKSEFLELAARERGNIDAITLALHGSMRVNGLGEVEGDILEELRKIFPETPIFVALDMHATVSRKMCMYADGMVGYKTAPHTDCTETGVSAAEMTLFALKNGTLPAASTIRVPMIIAGEKSGTDVEPMRSLIMRLKEVEQNEEVLAASYLLGFPWSDNSDSSVYAHVVTKHSQFESDRLAVELAEKFWEQRHNFVFVTEAYGVAEAVDKAFEYLNGAPVYLSDSGDNPTAGAASDNTELLSHLASDDRIPRLAAPLIYAGFYDPESTAACRGRVGEEIELSIGGRFDPEFSSVCLKGIVKNYVQGYVYAGIPCDVAVFSARGMDIILSDKHIGYTDPSLMRELGLDPESAQIVVCKLGYLTPGHSALAGRSILVLTKGGTNEDLASIDYREVPRPIYPLEHGMDYDPEKYRMPARNRIK